LMDPGGGLWASADVFRKQDTSNIDKRITPRPPSAVVLCVVSHC
jgi:hypothetical protein